MMACINAALLKKVTNLSTSDIARRVGVVDGYMYQVLSNRPDSKKPSYKLMARIRREFHLSDEMFIKIFFSDDIEGQLGQERLASGE